MRISNRVRSLADGVLFEFGPSRRSDLKLRVIFVDVNLELRTLFIMWIASLAKYRLLGAWV